MGNDDLLPVELLSGSILDGIKSSQVLIVSGETGSGKSTIIPKIIYQEFENVNIVITQPRRVAAISLCKYVSQLFNSPMGELVGYKVRFHNKTSTNTRIKYVTDGILIREAMDDPLLSNYSFILVDEVHERSIRSDVLLGIIKLALDKHSDLKVIIMSATLDCNNFRDFFKGSKYIHIPGRKFPLEYFYTSQPHEDYIELNLTMSKGDILVFLPGQEDIETMERLLRDKCSTLDRCIKEYGRTMDFKNIGSLRKSVRVKLGDAVYTMKKWLELDIVVLYAALSIDRQGLAFKPTPPNHRKVVIATNIAETSITITGIRFVVDSGLVKQRSFLTKTNFEALTVNPISKASAKQRAGRAGREGPGQVYRLYTTDSYNKMSEHTTPEIQCVDISSVYLELKMMGIKNPIDFPYIDPPYKNTILSAAITLCKLGAITADGNLTELGYMMGKIPLTPLHSKLLTTAIEFECVSEILTIVSMLSTEMSFIDSERMNPNGLKMRRNLAHVNGDHLTLLNYYNIWDNAPVKDHVCRQFGFNNNAFIRASDIRKQLVALMMSPPINLINITKCKDPSYWDNIRKCLCKANWINAAKLSNNNKSYITQVSNQEVYIHPSSVLFNRQPMPSFIVYNECTRTKRVYVHGVTEISNEWLLTFVPNWFNTDKCQVSH